MEFENLKHVWTLKSIRNKSNLLYACSETVHYECVCMCVCVRAHARVRACVCVKYVFIY